MNLFLQEFRATLHLTILHKRELEIIHKVLNFLTKSVFLNYQLQKANYMVL